MNCYVCGTPRPEGANYCPGCGRYCADDPNVRQIPPIPAEDIIIEEPVPVETSVPTDDTIPQEISDPFEETVPEAPCGPEPHEEDESSPTPEEQPEPEPVPATPSETPRKQKRHHPVLIPVLIMAGLFLVGSLVRFAFPYDRKPDGTLETTAPSAQKPPLPAGKNDSGSKDPLDSYTPTDDRCFRIENGAVRFVPEHYDGGPILVIPPQIDGQTVTAIAPDGFSGMEDVTTLILPDTLETIGDSAFANSEKLRGVFIPGSVTSIGSEAFAGCIDMESVSIPLGTTSIGSDAFDGCASLMYLFYEGTYEQWMALYNEYITPFTYACCSDGEYYHGAILP